MHLATASPETRPAYAGPEHPKPRGNFRWAICAMLFLATVLNYLDRYTLGFLAPDLQKIFHWTPQDFGWVLFAFQATYAVMNLPSGVLMDRLGLRKGYALGVVWWSFASMGHALATSVFGFGIWRAMLGIGEAVNFPAAVKTISEWFPQRERATATGVLNAGANVGAMIAPVVLALLVTHFGWKAAFVSTGALGFLWVVGWWVIYRDPAGHPRLNQEERNWILQDGPHRETLPSVPWQQLIGERRAWSFILGKTFTDPAWAFFLFWLPTFLRDVHKLSTADTGWVLFGIYLAADVGSLGGGFTSSKLIQLGWNVNRARKTTMAVAAILVPLVAILAFNDNLWLAVGLCGLAVAMHQWWSANLFTTASDMFPSEAMGTLVGMGQVGGSGVAMLVQPLVGYCIQHYHSYAPIFIVVAFAYPTGLFFLHLLAPKLDRVELKLAA